MAKTFPAAILAADLNAETFIPRLNRALVTYPEKLQERYARELGKKLSRGSPEPLAQVEALARALDRIYPTVTALESFVRAVARGECPPLPPTDVLHDHPASRRIAGRNPALRHAC